MAGEIYPPTLQDAMQAHPGWRRINYLGHRSRSEVSQVLGQARVGLVLFHPAPNYDDSQPNKLFEYLSAGIPIIASNFPAWRNLVEKVGCGLVVDPLDPKQIADAITWIFEHPQEAECMGVRGRQAVHEIFNWETQAKVLLDLYSRILN